MKLNKQLKMSQTYDDSMNHCSEDEDDKMLRLFDHAFKNIRRLHSFGEASALQREAASWMLDASLLTVSFFSVFHL